MAPRISTALARSIRLGTLRRTGYRLTVKSSDPTRNRVTVALRGRVGATVGSGQTVLVQRRASFTRSITLTLRLPRSVRSRVKRGTIELRITVADGAGNLTKRRETVRLR